MRKFLFISFFCFSTILIPASAADLDFGGIDHVQGGGNFTATLEPITGNLTCNNTANYQCQASGTPGTTVITGTIGTDVDIRCEKEAIVSNGTVSLDIDRSVIYIPSNGTNTCRGLNKTIATHTITGNTASDTVSWGARLNVKNVGNTDISGVYSSNNAGGSPQTIRLIFQ